MATKHITQKFVDTLKADGTKRIFHDTILTGLAVILYPTGQISFAVNTRISGKYKRITLGKHPVLSVSDARDKARPILQKMYEGVDPVEEKAKAYAISLALSTSLRNVYASYFKIRELKPKTENDMRRNATSYLSDWLDAPIRNVTRKMVEDRFFTLRDKSGLPTAAKTILYLSAVINFAKADETAGERLIRDNPCDVIKEKKIKRKIKARTDYLTEDDIRSLIHYAYTVRTWKAPKPEPDGVTDQGINLIMLLLRTGLRVSEALGLKWEDVDFAEKVFIVRDTKNGTDHYMPIIPQIRFLLDEQKKASGASDYVFPARYGTGHMTEPKSQVQRIRAAAGIKFTLHDLRRTFATHAKVNGADYDLIRRALNHKSGGSVTDSYIAIRVDMIRPVFQSVSEQYTYYGRGGDGKAKYYEDGTAFDFDLPPETE
jgi:integrase